MKNSRAFSLLELLVVIGIIGILVAVCMPMFSNSVESARATKCLSNMRNLALAWNGEGARSREALDSRMDDEGEPYDVYYEECGWIAALTRGFYTIYDVELMTCISKTKHTDSGSDPFPSVSMFEKDAELYSYALRNGWMHRNTGCDVTSFVCPSHLKASVGKALPRWSYLMNGYFDKNRNRRGFNIKAALNDADRRLLFAEVPFQKNSPGDWFPTSSSKESETDSMLQYKPLRGAIEEGVTVENIGGNHKSGKNWYAHVAFCDGHVEKLRVERISGENLRELTTLLCEGKCISRIGDRYDELDPTKEEEQE